MNSRLLIVDESPKSKKKAWEIEVSNRCEKYWREAHAAKKNPVASAWGKLRVERTRTFLQTCKLDGKIADLGCGNGPFMNFLIENGSDVTAIDAADPSFFQFADGIKFNQSYLPFLKCADAIYDGVLLTDVIEEIEPHLHRLLMSELSRILTKKGWALLSTSLDLYSEDAKDQFLALVETEFEILDKKISYNRLHFYVHRFLSAPSRFCKAARNKEYRLRQLEKREGWKKLWFYLNSIFYLSLIWMPLSIPVRFIKEKFYKSAFLQEVCERISKILWWDRAATHIIVKLQKKRLI